jgi:hypothetical protein
VQEGSRRIKKDQEGSRRIKKEAIAGKDLGGSRYTQASTITWGGLESCRLVSETKAKERQNTT